PESRPSRLLARPRAGPGRARFLLSCRWPSVPPPSGVDTADSRSARRTRPRSIGLVWAWHRPILREQPAAARLLDGGRAGRRAELLEHGGDVVGDRAFGEVERRRDAGVGFAMGQVREDLPLPAREARSVGERRAAWATRRGRGPRRALTR